MYHPGGTIEQAITEISKNNYVLPAIQREFVWRPEQIERLFDSLMQGYPFGAFLFWKVLPETAGDFQFYDFVKNYHQLNGMHCEKIEPNMGAGVTAVLDGQQRLTALNIGLRGSMRHKIKGKHWKNPDAYPTKTLHLNLLSSLLEDEDGVVFEFKFLESESIKNTESKIWFNVGDILKFKEQEDIADYVDDYDLDKDDTKIARRSLNRLYAVVRKDQTVAYYEENSQELDRVLNIFIRLNSGGTILSYSDLLLSIAVAQWTELDAREEIHSLVDTLNAIGAGFQFSHDFVLKAGLMLSDISSVGFKVSNFSKQNMATLQTNWPKIRKALIRVVQLAASLGLSSSNLRAESSLLPIAYYLYGIESPEGFEIKTKYQQDRDEIKDWLFRSLLKPSGIWGSGLDTLLTGLREELKQSEEDKFPKEKLEKAMSRRGKSLHFSEDEIDELLNMTYGDKRVFLLLSMLYPFIDLNNQFHVDHIYPISKFSKSKLRKLGYEDEQAEELKEWANCVANLQLLEGQLNKEKNAALPLDWINEKYPDSTSRAAYLDRHDIGNPPEDMEGFSDYVETRWEQMSVKMEKALSKTTG